MKQTNESAFVEAEKKRLSRRSNCRRGKRSKMRAFLPEFRLRAAKMCVEEGRTQAEVAGLLDVSLNTLNTWVLAYRRKGGADAALFRSSEPPRGGSEERPRLPGAVRELPRDGTDAQVLHGQKMGKNRSSWQREIVSPKKEAAGTGLL